MTSRNKCQHCGHDLEDKKGKNNNGFYLGIIIGHSINLQMNSSERYEFKKDYEKFKLRVTLINLMLLLGTFLFPSRPLDAACHFLVVWYYCTLTIRECILLINGSKMHWWWVAHHYLACVIGGVALTWPESSAYDQFRHQFILFTGYICLVQQLQYQYQAGCLRRLHALGVGDNMDVTLEGYVFIFTCFYRFASWMFSGLTFLLPFLTIAYLIELYNAYTLFYIWKDDRDAVWQVIALSVLFLIVGTGNIFFVAQIVVERMKTSAQTRIQKLLEKYSFLDPISGKKE